MRTRLRVFAVAGVLGTCVCARTRAYAYARARVHAYARARWSAARALRGQVRSYVRAFLRESSGVTRRLAKASNGDPDLATSDTLHVGGDGGGDEIGVMMMVVMMLMMTMLMVVMMI